MPIRKETEVTYKNGEGIRVFIGEDKDSDGTVTIDETSYRDVKLILTGKCITINTVIYENPENTEEIYFEGYGSFDIAMLVLVIVLFARNKEEYPVKGPKTLWSIDDNNRRNLNNLFTRRRLSNSLVFYCLDQCLVTDNKKGRTSLKCDEKGNITIYIENDIDKDIIAQFRNHLSKPEYISIPFDSGHNILQLVKKNGWIMKENERTALERDLATNGK